MRGGLKAPATLSNSKYMCHVLTDLLALPLGLYPNLEELGDYMGLSLNSEEVQKNLALLPVSANVSEHSSLPVPSSCLGPGAAFRSGCSVLKPRPLRENQPWHLSGKTPVSCSDNLYNVT